MSNMKVNAEIRSAQGTGASRRLRRAGKVPGVLYGGHKDTAMIEVDHKDTLMQLKQEAFHASILDLSLGGKSEKVLLRDVQMHPWKTEILHIDFQRVSAKEKISMRVPLHFINEETAPGVKLGGGVVMHMETDIEISCLPADLPEFVEVDLASLEIGESIHLSQVNLPGGVESVHLAKGGEDLGIVAVQKAKGSAADDTAADSDASDGGEEGAPESGDSNEAPAAEGGDAES